MQTNKLTYIGIVFFLISYSCNNIHKKKQLYQSGELRKEYYVDKKGLKQDTVTMYYKNGKVEWRGFYINDTLEGPSIEYYENGEMKNKCGFEKGLQSGEFIEFFSGGKLKQKSFFKNGKENGMFIYYYHNGKENLRIMMKDGETQYYIEYDSLGNVIDKKHKIDFHFINDLSSKDSVKVKVAVPGLYDHSVPVSIQISKVEKLTEGIMPNMKYNAMDSSYWHTFAPVKEVGKYIITVDFLLEKKFVNRLDTIFSVTQ